MERVKSAFDIFTGAWGLGFVPSWLILKPALIHEMSDTLGLFANGFAILASIFTAVWAFIRIQEHYQRRKAWKKHDLDKYKKV